MGALLPSVEDRDWKQLWEKGMEEIEALKSAPLVVDKGVQVPSPVISAAVKDEREGGDDDFWADDDFPDDE